MSVTQLVPDCGGWISALAMTIPLRLLQPDHAPKTVALGALAAAMPPETSLYLMTDDPAHPDFAAWTARHSLGRAQVIGVGADAPVLESEMWSQDPWMLADQDGRWIIQYPTNTDRPGRQAKWFAAAHVLDLQRPLLHLAGGNTLTGPDFRILGAASVEMTKRVGIGGLSWADALARHQALDPRPLSIFGFALPGLTTGPADLRQQPSHLDLVLSLTGLADADGRPLLLLADPRSGHAIDAPRTPGWADQLDAARCRLEADGFAVRRNPVPYVAHPQWSPNPNLRPYNNILLENVTRPGRSRPLVWLPQYGDEEPQLTGFDAANRGLWQDLGFDPVPVFGFSALARAGGGVRCASKVLKRAGDVCTQPRTGT
ncbi:hypothetical protein [Dongia rigui]|uniref:Agmatine deiminase n=1 Tax=Dongia rigui TaxID=940149 RepID=A0ABU5E092_9PROT|nr:hypothetical protein [Dongia rigui]MDY0872692.1 hypothetical protein [Dongia rigui]